MKQIAEKILIQTTRMFCNWHDIIKTLPVEIFNEAFPKSISIPTTFLLQTRRMLWEQFCHIKQSETVQLTHVAVIVTLMPYISSRNLQITSNSVE